LINRTSVFRMIIAVLLGVFASVLFAETGYAETKKLKLYFLHTGEKATIAFKKNGSFLPAGLKRINYFLRDWRRNEPTRMDPLLLDLVWEVYQKSGSSDYIHVISGYRSPTTNNMLRKRGRGVAKKSQHTFGKALDFFLPDVKLAKLRKIGLIKQVGGVGYYPRSGSPFVHMDTGRVRHWPRMSRRELVRVFPNGKTLHVPTDGKPLPGYNQAVAAFNGRKTSTKKIASAKGGEKERKSFFARLASLGKSDEDENAASRVPAPRKVKTTANAEIKAVLSNSVAGPEFKENQVAKYPELPLLADIPVPLISPRITRQRPAVENDGNIVVANLDRSSDVRTVGKKTGRLVRAQLVANAQLQPFSVNNTRFNSQQLPGDNQNLRNQLIAQATKQLRVQTLAPPRPGADVGSKFETALLASENNNTLNQNPVLTRSFSTGNINNLRSTKSESVITRSQIPSVQPTRRRIDILANRSDIAKAKTIPTRRGISDQSPLHTASLNNSDGDDAKDLASLELLRKTIENQNRALFIEKAEKSSPIDSSDANSQANLATVPTQSPLRLNTLIKSLEQAPAADSNTITRRKTNINFASLNSTVVARDSYIISSAPNPLDELSLGWNQSDRLAGFVLRNRLAVNAADKIRAPAYGRAAIRQMPKSVLTAGFIQSGSIQNFSSFTGKAINFQTFTTFN
jgi:uncharacterized protein YcbK (DUF882 family)